MDPDLLTLLDTLIALPSLRPGDDFFDCESPSLIALETLLNQRVGIERATAAALAVHFHLAPPATGLALDVTQGTGWPYTGLHLRTPARIRTGTAALVGTRAEVIERVDGRGGQVKIGGEIWSARTYDEDEVIETGKRVEVMKIDGVTALVSE